MMPPQRAHSLLNAAKHLCTMKSLRRTGTEAGATERRGMEETLLLLPPRSQFLLAPASMPLFSSGA